MQLLLFDEKNKWVKIQDQFEVKIDYCNVKQQMQLNRMLNSYLNKIEIGEDEKPIIDDKTSDMFTEYAQMFVKLHVKDWKGVTDGENDLPFVLENNEMSDLLLMSIINDNSLFWNIYNAISEVLKFNGIDKKK